MSVKESEEYEKSETSQANLSFSYVLGKYNGYEGLSIKLDVAAVRKHLDSAGIERLDLSELPILKGHPWLKAYKVSITKCDESVASTLFSITIKFDLSSDAGLDDPVELLPETTWCCEHQAVIVSNGGAIIHIPENPSETTANIITVNINNGSIPGLKQLATSFFNPLIDMWENGKEGFSGPTLAGTVKDVAGLISFPVYYLKTGIELACQMRQSTLSRFSPCGSGAKNLLVGIFFLSILRPSQEASIPAESQFITEFEAQPNGYFTPLNQICSSAPHFSGDLYDPPTAPLCDNYCLNNQNKTASPLWTESMLKDRCDHAAVNIDKQYSVGELTEYGCDVGERNKTIRDFYGNEIHSSHFLRTKDNPNHRYYDQYDKPSKHVQCLADYTATTCQQLKSDQNTSARFCNICDAAKNESLWCNTISKISPNSTTPEAATYTKAASEADTPTTTTTTAAPKAIPPEAIWGPVVGVAAAVIIVPSVSCWIYDGCKGKRGKELLCSPVTRAKQFGQWAKSKCCDGTSDQTNACEEEKTHLNSKGFK